MTEGKPKFDRRRAVEYAFRHLQESRTNRAEAALEWYYTEGQSLERSPVGGMLDALKLASAYPIDCPLCCSRERKLAAEPMAQRLHLIDPELAREVLYSRGSTPDGRDCPRCKGSGFVETTHSAEVERQNRREVTWANAAEPPPYQIDAQTTGHEVRDHGYTVDDDKRLRVGQITRWLAALPPVYSTVIVAYYGPDATRCAPVTPWGMHLAIMPLVAAGKMLLAQAKPPKGGSLLPVEVIRLEAVAQTQAPQPRRGELLEQAYREAEGARRDSIEALAGLM